MTFRNKILFSIWGVVLSLLVITFFIINYWTRTRVENTFTDELRANVSTLGEFSRLQNETLIRSCLVIAESPRLRAVAEIGDPPTAQKLAHEISSTTVSTLFLLTDRRGATLAQIIKGRGSTLDLGSRITIDRAIRHVATTDVWAVQGSVYRVVSVPILLEQELIGTLTLGFPITGDEIATLKAATGSDIILALGTRPIASTIDSTAAQELLSAMGSAGTDTATSMLRLPGGSETYLGTTFPLSLGSASQDAVVRYLILKPFSRETRRAMASVLTTFGVISLIFLGFTTVIGVVISRGMTRPITDLVKGTTEISRGNYDYTIAASGKDEISFLGSKFMDMSRALKEKMSELDSLNRDLLERNRILDETLKRLKEAQQELVQSELLAATGKLTAQLAHEINNPIHNIQSCLQTALQRLPHEAKGRDLIELALEEVGRMSRLTRQMLDIYRSSRIPTQFQNVDIASVLQETIESTREELSRSRISVRTAIDEELPPVSGSADKLKQVFLNLVLNA
ncbi:MAG TPA: histidine kinase dimerization/phospho-acceptor domain-containing protein, partial [Bacteroidota bacterium]|nr:histidine kinase dimerization/phospho-acceptor domain-containing protein [Bacteroidota bacterium]